MAKRGRIPSLVGGGAGAPKLVVAKRKRRCRRCEMELSQGTKCVQVAIPGSMGCRTYCVGCFSEMISKSREDLDRLEQWIKA